MFLIKINWSGGAKQLDAGAQQQQRAQQLDAGAQQQQRAQQLDAGDQQQQQPATQRQHGGDHPRQHRS